MHVSTPSTKMARARLSTVAEPDPFRISFTSSIESAHRKAACWPTPRRPTSAYPAGRLQRLCRRNHASNDLSLTWYCWREAWMKGTKRGPNISR
mmetsp:Transcript_40194/g.111693  ORF Transcript_40194/g.111693 Transcript_40194/m.111693 type:complete len:94 (+) Transcript_40194:73-354(+)